MLMNTHKLLANNILSFANIDMVFLIDEKKFVWGNVKPDYVSKYKLKKHFYDESIDMIVNKINFLASMSVDEIYNMYGQKKFSAELGVICHFLCDYFCFAHSERWKFKNALKRHVIYERNLSELAKDFNFSDYRDNTLKIEDVRSFIDTHLSYYEKTEGYNNDLIYAMYICNSVINTLLAEIKTNKGVERRVG